MKRLSLVEIKTKASTTAKSIAAKFGTPHHPGIRFEALKREFEKNGLDTEHPVVRHAIVSHGFGHLLLESELKKILATPESPAQVHAIQSLLTEMEKKYPGKIDPKMRALVLSRHQVWEKMGK